jgi:hypothetical protein
MNETPPTDDQGNDLEALYRNSSAQYPSKPSAKVRAAILEHSVQLAANRPGTSPGVARIPQVRRSSRPKWRRPVLIGSLAAAALAGVLVGPQFLKPSAPPTRDAPAPVVRPAPSEPAATGEISAAASADSVPPTVTGMRARLAAAAPSAPVEARDSEGRTALMLAVLQGHRDEVVALLRQGADANAADFAGVTPLQAARANHLPAIADALVQAGAR